MSCRRELGQLQDRIEEFGERSVAIWAISASSVEDAKELTSTYPGITFLADPSLEATTAFALRHRGGAFPLAAKDHVIAYPTTFLVDASAKVRWIYRSPRIMERASVDELLAAIDATGRRDG